MFYPRRLELCDMDFACSWREKIDVLSNSSKHESPAHPFIVLHVCVCVCAYIYQMQLMYITAFHHYCFLLRLPD